MEEKLKQLIIKLTVSGLPPSFQEHILARVHLLDEDTVDKILTLLSDMDGVSADTQTAMQNYLATIQEVVTQGERKQQDELVAIEQEIVERYTQDGHQ
jgi:hypothetical protein